MFAPEVTWKPPVISELPEWTDARRVCVDVETCDPQLRELGIGVRRGGYVVGIGFTIEDGPSHYLPIRHEGGDNMEVEPVLRYLRQQGEKTRADIVGANLTYDLDYLTEEDIIYPLARSFRDIQVADPLIYELHNSYSLKNIANRHGLPGKDETVLRQAAQDYGLDPKKELWRLPARFVAQYAMVDTQEPLHVLRRQERLIEENDLWDIWDLESAVLPVLLKMRRAGVRIDQEKLAEIEAWSINEETESLREVKRLTGVDIGVGNVWQPEAMARPLQALGIPVPKTGKGDPSVTKELLASIDHPVAKALAWARKTNKLRTTFASSVRTHMVNGRIHCTFNQIAREDEKGDQKGARYGRLSAVDPNLQQQPSRDEFASMWRSIYVPDEGGEWACLDYSQQEPRWTTHFAAKTNLAGARQAAQNYWDDPDLDNHTFMANLTGLDRKYAKCIYLGLCYGEGGAKLCDDLGLPTRWALAYRDENRRRQVEYYDTETEAYGAMHSREKAYVWRAAGEEGQHILDTFDGRAPFIKKLANLAKKRAEKVGEIRTVGGRLLHFPEKPGGGYDWTHKALNRLIQGSSADQTKRAMVELDRAGHYLQLQVHDEVDTTVWDRRIAFEMAEIMSTAMPDTLVPFRVDVEIGPSWGQIEEVAA